MQTYYAMIYSARIMVVGDVQTKLVIIRFKDYSTRMRFMEAVLEHAHCAWHVIAHYQDYSPGLVLVEAVLRAMQTAHGLCRITLEALEACASGPRA